MEVLVVILFIIIIFLYFKNSCLKSENEVLDILNKALIEMFKNKKVKKEIKDFYLEELHYKNPPPPPPKPAPSPIRFIKECDEGKK